MVHRSRIAFLAVTVVMAVSLAFGGSPAVAASRGNPSPPPAQARPGRAANPVVEMADSPEGPVLVTGPGAAAGARLALYEFSGDAFSPQPSAPPILQFHCTATNTTTRFSGSGTGTACTTLWPPLMATGPLTAGPGVMASGLSVAGPNSGFTPGQVEYFGHPLYTFVKDTPGTFVGENIGAFGGMFWLVSPRPKGDPVTGRATLGSELTASGPALATTIADGTRTIYQLSYDTPGTLPGPLRASTPPPPPRPTAPASTCVGACTAVWPPLLTDGPPMAGPGVNPALLGVLRRSDGTTQVTYAGWPVYVYFADLAPGAASGGTHGQYLLDNLADGIWWEVAPQGGPQAGSATLTTEDGLLGVSSSAFPPSNPAATVYTLSTDTSTTSACTGTCAKYWPPVLTSLPPTGPGLAGTIGTIRRANGTFQVTYDGHPLYFFSHQLTAGDAAGASIKTPFGTFSVVTP